MLCPPPKGLLPSTATEAAQLQPFPAKGCGLAQRLQFVHDLLFSPVTHRLHPSFPLQPKLWTPSEEAVANRHHLRCSSKPVFRGRCSSGPVTGRAPQQLGAQAAHLTSKSGLACPRF